MQRRNNSSIIQPMSKQFELTTENRSPITTVRLDPSEGYILGRTDDTSAYRPEIDLASYSAREKGVSRRHAALTYYRGELHVIDLESANGTYINGSRIDVDLPYPLRDTDELRLGAFIIRISERKA